MSSLTAQELLRRNVQGEKSFALSDAEAGDIGGSFQ